MNKILARLTKKDFTNSFYIFKLSLRIANHQSALGKYDSKILIFLNSDGLVERMKLLFLSIFNGEAIGTRQLFSIAKSKGYDTKLLFFKSPNVLTYEQRQKKHFSNQMDEITNGELDLLKKFILTNNFDIISVSLVSPYFALWKKLYPIIRPLGNFKIIIGGWQATLQPEQTLDYCDYVYRGEGEHGLFKLIENTSSSERIRQIDSRDLEHDINSFSPVIFDLKNTFFIEGNHLVHDDPYRYKTRYGIMTARGCPYHCSYCSNSYVVNNLYGKKWSKFRRKSVENVMNELLLVKATFPNIELFNFYDEVFNPPKEWLTRFCEEYKQKINLPFYAMYYPGTVREEKIKLLKNAGLNGVWIGVQSGSDRVRREVYNRKHSNLDVIHDAELFKKYDIGVRYDFIFDNPYETIDESIESIKLMMQLPEPYTLNLFSLKWFPNTDITTQALRDRIITENDIVSQKDTIENNYFIKIKEEPTATNFINCCLMYLSFLVNRGDLNSNKEKIHSLLEDYKNNKSGKILHALLKEEMERIK